MVDQVIKEALADEIARMDRIKNANNSYNGIYFPPLKPTKKGGIDDSTIPNFAKFIVNEGAAALFGAGLKFVLDSGADSTAAKALKDLLKKNKMPTLLNNLGVSGGIGGHAFIKIVPPKDTVNGFIRWIVLDPAEVNVTWDGEDISEVCRYKIQFRTTNKQGKSVLRKQLIEAVENEETDIVTKWTIKDFEAVVVSAAGKDIVQGEWVQIGSTIEWLYPWPPIVDCQNLPLPHCYYGMSDLEPDILHIIGRIHFVLSNTLRINRIHAHPKTIGSGFNANQMSTSSDEMTLLPAGGKIEALVATGDIAGSIEVYNTLREILFMITKIPPVVLGKMENLGNLAGIALRILYGPLMEVTRRKRDTYGDMLEALIERTLELMDFKGENVELEWGDPIPQNDVESRQIAMQDLDLGIVSLETIASKLGYDWAKEKKKIQAEETEGVRPPSVPPPTPAYNPNTDNIPQ